MKYAIAMTLCVLAAEVCFALDGCLHITVDPVPVVIEYRLKPVDLAARPDAGTVP